MLNKAFKNVFLSAVMSNMLNVLSVFAHYGLGIRFIVSEYLQHIQHIQHDSRKGRFFGSLIQHDSTCST